ncbi:MAG TPA: glycosyltransferase, partial [Azospirillum sp.]
MDDIALGEEKLGQIGPILAGYSGNQGDPGLHSEPSIEESRPWKKAGHKRTGRHRHRGGVPDGTTRHVSGKLRRPSIDPVDGAGFALVGGRAAWLYRALRERRRSLRVLLVHERYRQRGGEDATVDAEAALLAGAGIDVVPMIEDNRRIVGNGSAALALRTVWSAESRRAVARMIATHRPDVVHVHNTFPLLSPSIYGAARAHGVPVVQTLHNYRFLCPNALLLRDGAPCERCLGRVVKWPGVAHACFRGSRGASAAVAAMAGVHRLLGTWRRSVDLFLALTPFAERLFVAGGLPAGRLAVCPPVVTDPGAGPAAAGTPRAGALFVGRLSPEKGLETLIEAWRGVDRPLDVIGEGPLADDLMARAPAHVRFLGPQPPDAVSAAMARAELLVFPSLCYENFPLVVAEAMAHGLPVLASSGRAVGDIVEDGVTGTFARPGDAADWRDRAAELLAQPDRLRAMGAAGRATY